MCEYCAESAFNTLIEADVTIYAENIFGKVHLYDEPFDEDMSVALDIRCGSGYIRLGDRTDMGCIDHGGKIKINYCPMCGRKLK